MTVKFKTNKEVLELIEICAIAEQALEFGIKPELGSRKKIKKSLKKTGKKIRKFILGKECAEEINLEIDFSDGIIKADEC